MRRLLEDFVAVSILVVEDEPISSRTLCRLLDLAGGQVRAVQTVAAALEALRQAPDLLILDLMLPDGEGLEVLRQIREKRLPTKVAVVTASQDPHRLARLLPLRPDLMLLKPIHLSALIDWIQSHRRGE